MSFVARSVKKKNALIVHNHVKYIIYHSRNCKKSRTVKELWDRLGRRRDIGPTNKCIFRHFHGAAWLLLNEFHLLLPIRLTGRLPE